VTAPHTNAQETQMHRHEIPTHLNVEDKAVLGLTMRQLLTAAVGLALAYGAASEMPGPFALRLGVAAMVVVAAALVTLWRPAGRPLEVWTFVLLQYLTTARVAVWRPGDQSDVDDGDPLPATVVRLPVRPRSGIVGRREQAEGAAMAGRVSDA
jgi:hypothetical protein